MRGQQRAMQTGQFGEGRVRVRAQRRNRHQARELQILGFRDLIGERREIIRDNAAARRIAIQAHLQ